MTRRRSRAAMTASSFGGNERLSANVFILFVTLAVLFVAVDLTDGGFANSVDTINRNLEVAIRDLRENMPVYRNYTDKGVYLSSNVSFNPNAMAGLYNLTRRFIDLVVGNDILMKDLIIFDDHNNQKINPNISIGELLKNYWGFVTVIVVLAVLTIFLPLCGLLFCCCRCCGNCGKRPQPCDKKRDLCKKILQGTLLILLGTAMLFCVVCAFATNQQLRDGVDELADNIEIAKNDTITYLDSTTKQANNLCVENYEDFAEVFTQTIKDSGLHVMQQLNIWNNATAMMDLYSFVTKTIPSVKINLNSLKEDINSLRATASQLNDAMRKVKKDLLEALINCTVAECIKIKNEIATLQTNIDFNKLPDVKPTIEKLEEFNTNDMNAAAQSGMDKLNNIERSIKEKLETSLDQANNKVYDAGDSIKKYLTNVTNVISDVQGNIKKLNTKDVDRYVKEYGPYRYYGSLAISCVLLLITLCIALGLICGICGKRPDGYSDNCCNKGAGGQFLICAVMLMFISAVVIGLVTLITLVAGLTVDRTVCQTLRHPSDSSVMEYVDKLAEQQMSDSGIDLSLKEVLERCYRNESIYKVLNLKDKFDIDTIKRNFDVSQFLNEIESELDEVTRNLDFEILSGESESRLTDLSKFTPNIDFEKFEDELRNNFINLNLTDVSDKLEKLVETPGLDDNTKRMVKLSILHINTYDEKILVPMKSKSENVIKISKQLDTDLKMNSTSFTVGMKKMIDEIKDAQDKLKNDGTTILQAAVRSFSDIVKNQVNSYLDRVTYIAQNELGQCGPMNVIINATLVATCDKIILPWNGFWFTLMISLLLFIPTIIVSVKLASLYKKYKQYGPCLETEYLYDAYADRGVNIPLNSRGGKRGGKKKKGKKTDDRPQNMGGEVVAREYTAASHPSDSRYADMAPKNWEEFPNGGPPQYQRAPTEYERPPPYYYPGTADQQ